MKTKQTYRSVKPDKSVYFDKYFTYIDEIEKRYKKGEIRKEVADMLIKIVMKKLITEEMKSNFLTK